MHWTFDFRILTLFLNLDVRRTYEKTRSFAPAARLYLYIQHDKLNDVKQGSF